MEEMGAREAGAVALDAKCVQCGNENDLLVAFTRVKICGKCIRKNQQNIAKGKK